MIRKYRYGTPFDTEALTKSIDSANGEFPYGKVSLDNGFDFTYIMDEDDIVYGLGEANRCKLRSNGMPVPLLRNGYSIFNGTKYR